MQTTTLNNVLPLVLTCQTILFLITPQGYAWMSAYLVPSEIMVLLIVFRSVGGPTMQILPPELVSSTVLMAILVIISQLHAIPPVLQTPTLILSHIDA